MRRRWHDELEAWICRNHNQHDISELLADRPLRDACAGCHTKVVKMMRRLWNEDSHEWLCPDCLKALLNGHPPIPQKPEVCSTSWCTAPAMRTHRKSSNWVCSSCYNYDASVLNEARPMRTKCATCDDEVAGLCWWQAGRKWLCKSCHKEYRHVHGESMIYRLSVDTILSLVGIVHLYSYTGRKNWKSSTQSFQNRKVIQDNSNLQLLFFFRDRLTTKEKKCKTKEKDNWNIKTGKSKQRQSKDQNKTIRVIKNIPQSRPVTMKSTRQ